MSRRATGGLQMDGHRRAASVARHRTRLTGRLADKIPSSGERARWYAARLTNRFWRGVPRMINYSALEVLHRHDDGSAYPMKEHHLEEHDPERTLLRGIRRGARLFRCEVCADEVIVQPSADTDDEGSA
jgi:hypothetical protein